MKITHEIVLDVNIDNLETINIKQYTKNSHILHIRLTENGIDFPIDSNTVKCQFKMLTPNENHILIDAVINSDGTITVTLPEAACLAPGNGKAELLFVQPKNSDTNYDSILLSMSFNINIIKSVYNHDDIVPYDDFDALNQALIKVNKDYEYVMTSAKASADAAEASKNAAIVSANNAEQHKNTASNFATTAQSAAGNAANSANNALQYSNNAETSKNTAWQKANAAANSATEAKSYAVGDTNTRPNETTENAKFYYTEAKKYYDNLSQAGTVTGIKGSAESSYRTGNVNLTAANIGLGNVDNTSDANKNVNSAKSISVQTDNWRQGTDLPSAYPQGATIFFSNNPNNRFNGIQYCTIHTIKGYSNMACIQFLYPYNTNHDKFYFREALYNTDSWRPWYEMITSANIGSQSVNYASSAGSAATATKTTQDGNGNNIVSTYLSKTDASSTYLPKSGGTITGNLTLKGNGNYGNKINFGNGDNVHLYEDTNNHLEIKGSCGINLATSSAAYPVTVNGKKILDSMPKFTRLTASGKNYINVSSIINIAKELKIQLYGGAVGGATCMFTWDVDPEIVKLGEDIVLLDGYKYGSLEGMAQAHINTSIASAYIFIIDGVSYIDNTKLTVSYR